MGRRRRKHGQKPVAGGDPQPQPQAAPPARKRGLGWAYWLCLALVYPCLMLGSYLLLEPVGLLALLAHSLGGAMPVLAWGLLIVAGSCLLVWCRLEQRRRPGPLPFWAGPALVGVGVLLGHLAFPPADLSWLGFVCFVPWLYLLVRCRTRQALALTWVFGYLHLFTTSSWIQVVAPEGLVGAAFLQGSYGVLFGLAIRRGQRRLRLPLSLLAAVFWVAEEYWRSAFLFIKYPLCQLGYTQSSRLWLIQIAELTSVYGVSFFVLSVNGALADFFLARPRLEVLGGMRRQLSRFAPRSYVLPLVLAVFLVCFGLYRLGPGQPEFVAGPRVALVQGNLSQRLKDLDKNRGWTRSQRLQMYGSLTLPLRGESVDLVCWPETILPMPCVHHRPVDDFPGWQLATREDAMAWARLLDAPFLFGQMHFEFLGAELEELGRDSQAWYLAVREKYYALQRDELKNGVDYVAHNSAFMLAPDGEVLGRYDKLCPVPMSEYRPFQKLWPFMFDLLGNLVPAGFTHYAEGAGPVHMRVTAKRDGSVWNCAPSICWDTVFPEDMAQIWGYGSDFMVSVSNDAWFEGTTNPQMMVEATAFRAIEGRRGIARVANMGVSSFYDPCGRRVDLEVDGEHLGVRGTLLRNVETSHAKSFYVRYGNIFVDGVVLAAIILFAWSLRGRRDSRVTQV